jgi:hypothetical protein
MKIKRRNRTDEEAVNNVTKSKKKKLPQKQPTPSK